MEQDFDIGARLVAIRSARSLSQRRLAKQSGVANATISQIESGDLNPTVGLLKKILDGVPMTLSDFFASALESAEPKIFFSARELSTIAKGGVSYRQIGANLANKAIQLLHEHYAPGASTGRLPLRHAGEECGIVLRGALRVTVDGQSRILTAGEAYYFKSDRPHSFKNEGVEQCELITACTPPSF